MADLPTEDIDLSDVGDPLAPLDRDIRNRKGSNESTVEAWDSFKESHPDKDTDLHEDRNFYNFVIKLAKILAYVMTFLIILGGAVVAKSTILLMTSQLQKDRTISYCWKHSKNRQYISHSSLHERLSWTWAIYFAFLLPEAQALFRGLRLLIFKGHERPSCLEFFLPVICETAHTIGLALLVYTVLPTMDVAKGAMLTNAFCLVPAILGMLSRGFDKQFVVNITLDVIAIGFQLTALFIWPLFTLHKSSDRPWLLPISTVLISFGWWENFIEPSSTFTLIREIGKMKKRLRSTRPFTYTFIPIWKAGIFLTTMLCCVWMNEGSFTLAFDEFDSTFKNHKFTVEEKRPQIASVVEPNTSSSYLKPGSFSELSQFRSIQYTMIVQMVAAYACYIVAKFACKISIQEISFSFPLLLSVPVTVLTLISLCSMRDTEVCFLENVMPGYLFWTCPKGDFWKDFLRKEHIWAWILWISSQTWITIHIWQPKGVRLAKTEKIFETPMYNSVLIDQSLVFNRRRDEDSPEVEGVDSSETNLGYTNVKSKDGDSCEKYTSREYKTDKIPRIIGCATCWHETKNEMIELLKSIFRMDEDQRARRVINEQTRRIDPDYYEYETHIFFDDAFELPKDYSPKSLEDFPMIINSYVRLLMTSLETAAKKVHQGKEVRLKPPKKISTPYGGQLEWTLPGKTKLIVHIKDNAKIRHKKRWSQVMYMYYLLGYGIMELPISDARKNIRSENTFILAMDGDIDFQPNAVRLLVDLMRKNKKLGAACGRIHPTGRGPMVWYQTFEYAIGHWLQKSTEHVLGCVLCSPGCFSLFRAKALMEDDVMKKYTTKADEPIHYVQYDQGEDRWLCTLILQRGYKVEYCAASDAKTHAPEGFDEFYNQRRRWVPSTMANVMDLLRNSKRLVKINPDISWFYIFYQIVMMGGTILGPGTIFLMLIGAFATAFNLSQWNSFLYNFIPILLFILICYFCKQKTQLIFARILSIIYALSMVAVVVAIILQVTDDGLFSPSSIFLVSVAASFVLAGAVHPTELFCLVHGFVYYLTIPSMYLLLMIYSLFNLNDVSWGTRDDGNSKSKQADAEKLRKGKKKGLFSGFQGNKDEDLSFVGLFKLMLFGKDKSNESDALEMGPITDNGNDRTPEVLQLESPSNQRQSLESLDFNFNTIAKKVNENELTDQKEKPHVENLFWMEDEDLKDAKLAVLPEIEIRFWRKLIEKYLQPIRHDLEKEEKMAKELLELRNELCFAFLMINAVFVVLVFLLQLEKETVHLNWPLGRKSNVTYTAESSEITVSLEYLELEPIGLVFVGFFAIVLLTQFIGMCFHRFGTFTQILAITTIASCSPNISKITNKPIIKKYTKSVADSTTNNTDPVEISIMKQNYTKREVDLEANLSNVEKFETTADRRNSQLLNTDETQLVSHSRNNSRLFSSKRRRTYAFDDPIRRSGNVSTLQTSSLKVPTTSDNWTFKRKLDFKLQDLTDTP